MDFKKLQKEIYQNKVDKGFNLTDIHLEFLSIYAELGEAFDAYRKKLPDMKEEFADVAIFLFGLAEMMGIDLEEEIVKKMEKNKNRKYKTENGVLMKVENKK